MWSMLKMTKNNIFLFLEILDFTQDTILLKYMKLKDKKIAIVCDWISDWGGAELVLSHLLEIFPEADIYTSVFWQQENPLLKNYEVIPS